MWNAAGWRRQQCPNSAHTMLKCIQKKKHRMSATCETCTPYISSRFRRSLDEAKKVSDGFWSHVRKITQYALQATRIVQRGDQLRIAFTESFNCKISSQLYSVVQISDYNRLLPDLFRRIKVAPRVLRNPCVAEINFLASPLVQRYTPFYSHILIHRLLFSMETLSKPC